MDILLLALFLSAPIFFFFSAIVAIFLVTAIFDVVIFRPFQRRKPQKRGGKK